MPSNVKWHSSNWLAYLAIDVYITADAFRYCSVTFDANSSHSECHMSHVLYVLNIQLNCSILYIVRVSVKHWCTTAHLHSGYIYTYQKELRVGNTVDESIFIGRLYKCKCIIHSSLVILSKCCTSFQVSFPGDSTHLNYQNFWFPRKFRVPGKMLCSRGK